MSSTQASPAAVPGGVREARRLETRARLFDAALAEIARRGLATADVSAIAGEVGVARGTFYFHFPTKEHVLIELERNEEIKMISELNSASDNLTAILAALIDRVLDAERRLGAVVFRDMLGLHFSSTHPADVEMAQHPLAEFLVGAIGRAQDAGDVVAGADAAELSMFFLTGLFALLATGINDPETLNRYVATIVKGMEKR